MVVPPLLQMHRSTLNYEYLLLFSRHSKFPQINDFEAKGMLEILKMSSKTGDRSKAIPDLQNNEECFYFKLRIGNLIKSYKSKSMVHRYQSYSCLKGQGYSCFSESNS